MTMICITIVKEKECDELTRDDDIALTLTLNQPAQESGLLIESVHWSLVEGLPSGDVITVDDVMYQDTLGHGNKCEKNTICGTVLLTRSYILLVWTCGKTLTLTNLFKNCLLTTQIFMRQQ